MKKWIRHFLNAERKHGWGFAFRYIWINLWAMLLKGYACFYCKKGAVRSIPAKCPLCHKNLRMVITRDTTLGELTEAAYLNGVYLDFAAAPILEDIRTDYALAE